MLARSNGVRGGRFDQLGGLVEALALLVVASREPNDVVPRGHAHAHVQRDGAGRGGGQHKPSVPKSIGVPMMRGVSPAEGGVHISRAAVATRVKNMKQPRELENGGAPGYYSRSAVKAGRCETVYSHLQ